MRPPGPGIAAAERCEGWRAGSVRGDGGRRAEIVSRLLKRVSCLPSPLFKPVVCLRVDTGELEEWSGSADR